MITKDKKYKTDLKKYPVTILEIINEEAIGYYVNTHNQIVPQKWCVENGRNAYSDSLDLIEVKPEYEVHQGNDCTYLLINGETNSFDLLPDGKYKLIPIKDESE